MGAKRDQRSSRSILGVHKVEPPSKSISICGSSGTCSRSSRLCSCNDTSTRCSSDDSSGGHSECRIDGTQSEPNCSTCHTLAAFVLVTLGLLYRACGGHSGANLDSITFEAFSARPPGTQHLRLAAPAPGHAAVG